MQRRILLIAVVFVAGFGIGYGMTWLFVGSPDRGAAGQPEPRAALKSEPSPAQPVQPAVAPDASVGGGDAVVAADTSQAASDVALAVADAGPRGSDAADAQAVVAVADAVKAPEVAAPREIDLCLNKVCKIDFGGVSGGISVRKGKLEHGAEVDWDKDFGRADKVGTLDSERNVKVEVLGIGLTGGEPTAAYIARKVKRGTQKGVIALKIGDRRLSLVPLDD